MTLVRRHVFAILAAFFDGKQYPSNPSLEPAASAAQIAAAKIVLSLEPVR